MSMLLNKARKLMAIMREPIWRTALLRHRVAAGVEHSGVLAQLVGCSTVVDIGANRGQFALAVRRCIRRARIISFEPLSKPAAVYRDVFADDVQAQIVEVAIGPDAGTAIIHLSARDDSSSLLPIMARQNAQFPGTAEVGTATIRVAQLGDEIGADAFGSPALLKIDVQGFELQALRGCESLLNLFTWVYVECSFVELYSGQAFADAVIVWLHERGFCLSGVYNLVYDANGCAIQADFLFSRN